MSLAKIKLGHSPLTDTMYLYRHGKDEMTALEKRPIEQEIFDVMVAYFTHGAPKGSFKEFSINGQWYRLGLEVIDGPTEE